MKTIFSYILLRTGKIQIGLYLSGLYFSPDLNIGVTRAFSKQSGNLPQVKDLLIRWDSRGETRLLIIFKDRIEYMELGAFLRFSDIITLSTSAEVNGDKKKLIWLGNISYHCGLYGSHEKIYY